MSDKINFQVDGIGINAEYHFGSKESDFIKAVVPGIPDRFGSDADKAAWAKGAFELMNKAFPAPVAKEK